MKRKIALVMGLAVVAVSFAFVGSVRALDARSGEDITTPGEQVVESSSYQAGSKVTVDGTIKGDLFCAGQDVVVNGTVQGDVLCAGQTITIKGTVRGDVRAAAQSVTIEGAVDGSVTLLGQRATLQSSSTVGRDVTIFSEHAFIDGRVGRDVLIGSEKATINGEIVRNVEVLSEHVAIPTGKIGGNLVYTSDKPAALGESAVVAGTTQQKQPTHQRPQETFFTRYVAGPAYWFIALFLIGLVLLGLMPKLLVKTDHAIRVHPLLSLGTGLVTLIVAPLLVILLVASVVGLPLALVIGALWLAVLVASFALSGYTLGLILTKHQKGWNVKWWQKSLSLLIGLFVLLVVAMVPFIGGLAMLLAMLWGMGSLTLAAVQLSTKRKKTA